MTERKLPALFVVHQAVGRILIDGRIVLLDGETAVAADFDEERLRHIALGIAHAGAEGQYSVGIARATETVKHAMLFEVFVQQMAEVILCKPAVEQVSSILCDGQLEDVILEFRAVLVGDHRHRVAWFTVDEEHHLAVPCLYAVVEVATGRVVCHCILLSHRQQIQCLLAFVALACGHCHCYERHHQDLSLSHITSFSVFLTVYLLTKLGKKTIPTNTFTHRSHTSQHVFLCLKNRCRVVGRSLFPVR